MNYSYRDVYPTMGVDETSTEAIPTPEEQNALHEDVETAVKSKTGYASGRNMMIGVLVLGCLVVFLGGN